MTFREQQAASTEGNSRIFTSCTTQEGIYSGSCSQSAQYLYEIWIALASERGLLCMELLGIS
jgi:hypothetical protein